MDEDYIRERVNDILREKISLGAGCSGGKGYSGGKGTKCGAKKARATVLEKKIKKLTDEREDALREYANCTAEKKAMAKSKVKSKKSGRPGGLAEYQEILKGVRKENPNLPIRQARQKASRIYYLGKK